MEYNETEYNKEKHEESDEYQKTPKKYFNIFGYFFGVAWGSDGWRITDQDGFRNDLFFALSRNYHKEMTAYRFICGSLMMECIKIEQKIMAEVE